MIAAIGLDTGLHMDFGSYAGYGIPYQVVTSTTPSSTVAFDYSSESDHVGYPIPATPLIEGGSDRHILLVDRDACRLYELFNARKAGGSWAAGSGATWDMLIRARYLVDAIGYDRVRGKPFRIAEIVAEAERLLAGGS